MDEKKICIKVTEKCFMNCAGCYDSRGRSGEALRPEEYVRFASVLRNLGYRGLTLTGGDPLIRPDICQITSDIHNLGYCIHLDTTGKLFLNSLEQKTIAQSLSETVDLVGIPLDGSDDAMIKIFRGEYGSTMSETEKILKLLNLVDCNVSINTVVHGGNSRCLNKIYEVITKYSNIKRWELHQFVSIDGSSKINKQTFDISDENFFEAVNNINNINAISINPKPKRGKENFTYLDFNGNYIKITKGVRKVLFNIIDMSDVDLEKNIMLINE